MRKRVSLIILSLLMLFSLAGLSGCSQKKMTSDSWSTIKQNKRVVVGLDDSFVPMGFRAKDGQLKGFDIDLARAVFKRYGIKVDFQTIDWSMNATELRNHTIDLIWNGYTVTPERKRVVRFSDDYLQNKQILVTLKKNNINSFQQMQGKELGVQTGSSGYSSLESNPKLLKQYIHKQTPVLYDTFNEAFIDLNAGRIQGMLIDRVYANYYIAHQANRKDYQVTQGNFAPENFAVGMRKSDKTMQKRINASLRALYKDGTIAKISRKWFGEDDTINPANYGN
ncbi:amino acid ABC transporter substrate-binding protein [Loigolactobacillus backii]|uniref:Amino acid ABC transporter substrate-binding protein n=1 Tax=Loigolactobacillus backii TaxID=375175 RepID=A0A192H2W4_9LACO|nr:amino acid ABC transporter substrate-binding protein [Loigolactobacillus backii]ANK59753.1 amino acid ABC transporter substrate-binding protein [Loigolactobacillus backii]ANK63154.1 amino acid ABC transporter substrate-binding protein [Loigolactobacillus backii]ANK64748.1 amino acid ABC transporter substrate-binding protein [Loigolactobacillus backii]ANK66803.1 amino acid ABC transporter substrate-binding protein [Loigolactobacillus backii]ANK69839.1 amino acid ABC transporter substrate-bin